jgi:hypothetical protein
VCEKDNKAMTPEDKRLIDRLLKRNRKWAERWRVFEDSIADDLAEIMRNIEAGKRQKVMSFVTRLALDENGYILDTPDNYRVTLAMLKDVGGYTDTVTGKDSPFGRWVVKNMDKSATLGVRKALDVIGIADKASLPRKGYKAKSAMRLATKAQDILFDQMHARSEMDLNVLRRVFLENIFDPNGNIDSVRKQLTDTGQIEGMLDSIGRRVTADERADRIARYEPQTAARKAHDEALNDFYYDGEALPLDEQYRLWDAVMDDRVSDKHAGWHGKVKTVEQWEALDGLPPTRPRCRCDAIMVEPHWFSEETQKERFEGRAQKPIDEEIAA